MTQVTAGILKATTAEALLLEAALLLQVLESREEYNTTKKNLVNVTIDTDTKVATITARISITFNVHGADINQLGGLRIVEYLASPGGALENTSLSSANVVT